MLHLSSVNLLIIKPYSLSGSTTTTWKGYDLQRKHFAHRGRQNGHRQEVPHRSFKLFINTANAHKYHIFYRFTCFVIDNNRSTDQYHLDVQNSDRLTLMKLLRLIKVQKRRICLREIIICFALMLSPAQRQFPWRNAALWVPAGWVLFYCPY